MDFVEMFNMALKAKHWNCSMLAEDLKEKGYTTSSRSLQRYRTGEVVPNQDIAEAIMSALDSDATSDEIAIALASTSKQKRHDYNSDANRYIQRGLRLSVAKLALNPGEDNATARNRLNERIKEVEPERPTLNRYVSDLICFDLKNHVLPVHEGNEEGDD